MREAKPLKIAEALRRDILSGKWGAGNPFPSERALARRLKVSRPTIHLAIQQLQVDGLLSSRLGAGTFLTSKARGAGGRIGLIIPGISHEEIFPPICSELANIAQTSGYALMLGDISSKKPAERAAKAKQLAEEYAAQGVAGVIFQPLELVSGATRINQEIVSTFENAHIPVVLLDYDVVPPPDRSELDLVGIDNFDAGRRVALHLVAAGARRLAFLMRANWGVSVRDRYAGVKYVATETGCAAGRFKIVAEPHDKDFFRSLFAEASPPDAIVCGNDVAAAKLMATLRAIGKRVPRDVMLVGFDDVQVATAVAPQLTTVHQPCADLARTVFDFLLRRIANQGQTPLKVLLAAPLVLRASTRRRRGANRSQEG